MSLAAAAEAALVVTTIKILTWNYLEIKVKKIFLKGFMIILLGGESWRSGTKCIR